MFILDTRVGFILKTGSDKVYVSKKATKFDKIFTINLTDTTFHMYTYGEDFVKFCGLLRKHKVYSFSALFFQNRLKM